MCTPDLYVFDRDRRLAYHGRLDDSPRDASKVKRRELREAVDALLAGKKPEPRPEPFDRLLDQVEVMACSPLARIGWPDSRWA